MGVIKSRNSAGVAKRRFEDLGDLRQEAERLLETARLEAARIVDEARVEARRLMDEARPAGQREGVERGLTEGREQGRREAREQVAAEHREQLELLVARWTEALDAIESGRDDLLQSARADVIEFGVAVGRRITHRVIEADPTVVRDQVAEALGLLAEPGAVTLSIHPEDRPLVEEVLGEIVRRVLGCRHVELREDEGVQRGGCIVVTAAGHIDATIERQIDRIAEALLDRGEREASGAGPP